MKGKGFLKVTGILMIIGGAICIIAGLIAVLAISAFTVAGGDSVGLYMAASIFALLSGIVELVAGIMGVKNCDKPEKAMGCIVCGLIVVALTIVSSIFSVIIGAGFDWVSLLFGLVLPILYLIGAYMNKNSAAAPPVDAAPPQA